MKAIREMTAGEAAAEIRGYICQKDKGYAFISYSHRDRNLVYPLVLAWMRAGYNIYIDLDFERHGSDSNWADLMLSTLSSRFCRMGLCFKSAHYRYSYASLLELLTMRGEAAANRHSGKKFCVDTVALENIPDEDEIPDAFREQYALSFQDMKSWMGERFLSQNPKEAALLLEGLRFWMEDGRTKKLLGPTVTAEKMNGYILDAYRTGYQDFYPQIAYLIKTWFISQNLNGNDYTPRSSLAVRFERFDGNRVERVRENILLEEDAALFTGKPESPPSSPRTGPYLVRKGTGEVIPLTTDVFTLGRSASCSYVLAGNRAIGRLHAQILVQETECAVVDQYSKNRTYLNGAALEPGVEYPLAEGDVIRLSSEQFVFHTA